MQTNSYDIGADAYQANRRAAEHLRTVRGVGDYPRYTEDAINRDGERAIFEVLDLIAQIAANDPAQAQELFDKTYEGLTPEMQSRLETVLPSVEGAGGPGPVHVDAYTQNRDGQSVGVRAHERSAPGSGPDVEIADASDMPPMTNPVPGGKMRGDDAWGSGHFGASRGKRKHQGIDIVVSPGSTVSSPVDGTVMRTDVVVYPDAPHFSGVEIETDDGSRIKIFYVQPDIAKGSRIKAGDPVGTAEDFTKRYGPKKGGAITPHIHMEVRKDGKIVDPTGAVFGQ